MLEKLEKVLRNLFDAQWFGAPVAAWTVVGLLAVTGLVCVILAFRLRRVRVSEKKEVQVELGLELGRICDCRRSHRREK